MLSPLHEDQPLSQSFRAEASADWKSATAEALTMLDDSMPEHAGSAWCTSHLWVTAQELSSTRPVVAAALLLLLSQHSGLLKGPMP